MHAAIDDVHHRHRQGVGLDAADIAIERQVGGIGRRLGHGQRHAQDGIGAQPRLVGGAVQLDHGEVDLDLVLGIEPGQSVEYFTIHRGDRLFDALAAIALAAVPQLDRLMRAGRGTRGNRRPADAAVFQTHIHFHGGIASGVENLAAGDIEDGGHGGNSVS